MRQTESMAKPILRKPESTWPQPADQLSDDAQRLQRLRAMVRLLDSAFEIPGTRFRLGLDAIVGLIPGFGDLVTTAVSAWILNEARLLGVSRRTRIRMGWNIAVDFLVGAVPLAGDIFDAAWKANVKNLALIERELARRAGHAGGRSLRSSVPLMTSVEEPGHDVWPASDTLARERLPGGETGMKPTIATAAIVAICAAIASFMSGAFWGLILAIVAVVAGGLGMMIAASPRRRGGVLSLVSIALGLIALVKAVLVALF